MSTLTFKPATRKGIKPFIGLFGGSGGGKTMTALILARGLAGPTGKIGIVDTENERAQIFAGLIPGGFEHLSFDAPFSPERYSEVLGIAEAAGIDALVIDSMTHEWNGEGGYLDTKEAALSQMAGSDWKKREKCGLAAAARCKPAHNRFVQRLLRSRMAIIACFRAKPSVKMTKNAEGRTEIQTSEHARPIQESGLIFEMLISAEVLRVDGKCGCLRIDANDDNTKWTHPDIPSILPRHGEQVTVEHGAAIARWCEDPSGKPVAKKGPDADALRARIFTLFDQAQFPGNINEWLEEQGFVATPENIATLGADRLLVIGPLIKKALENIT